MLILCAMFSRSLRRFLHYLRPYRGLVLLSVVTGVVRYLIPLALPWVMKVVIDEVLAPRAAPHPLQLHVLMSAMIGLYIAYGFISYWRANLSGVAGHRLIFDL